MQAMARSNKPNKPDKNMLTLQINNNGMTNKHEGLKQLHTLHNLISWQYKKQN